MLFITSNEIPTVDSRVAEWWSFIEYVASFLEGQLLMYFKRVRSSKDYVSELEVCEEMSHLIKFISEAGVVKHDYFHRSAKLRLQKVAHFSGVVFVVVDDQK